MLSRFVAFPFVFAALIFLYLTWEKDASWAMYIVPNVVALAVVYVFSPQIDWWWYNRNVPELDPHLRMILTKQHTFYSRLSEENKKRFRDRIVLYTKAVEFMPQAIPSVPVDIQGIIAANIVHLTFGWKDYRLKKFEHIIVYPKPFPSPQYPENFHTSEIYPEDKVVMFAIQQLFPGTISPTKNYNIGLHEYARAFLYMYPDDRFPSFDESIWEKLEAISGFSKDYIFKHINRPDIDPLPVSICHFLIFPQRFQQLAPEVYRAYKEIFNLDPMNGTSPVVVEEVAIGVA